ncbi:hypothetical protein [Stenotrophomonas sp.]|uniref:hypothetical protein n=1 Tax=Stenotrophomonas sp. TaxID=69392 RepID=UPI0028AD9343|nr:hypothetical protein [Stenotrophomonas sp.]
MEEYSIAAQTRVIRTRYMVKRRGSNGEDKAGPDHVVEAEAGTAAAPLVKRQQAKAQANEAADEGQQHQAEE